MNYSSIQFADTLMAWYRQNPRYFPWKERQDAYAIWLSEIILQQTRVEQGTPYYERFLRSYPTVFDLAKADEQDVLKLWEGLGYYSRARNLLHTAKHVVEVLDGQFPADYKQLVSLKGIGPYTGAAIASFAFDLPYAVVDGNVYRVLARIFGVDTDIGSSLGKKQFAELAQNLLSKKDPAAYNQAIMNFGNQVCKPTQPSCPMCPFQKKCVALSENKVNILPVKLKKKKKRIRHFHYIVFRKDNYFWIRQRVGKDIWRGLYEFPYVEAAKGYDIASILENRPPDAPVIFSQLLTHQKIIGYFTEVKETEPIGFDNLLRIHAKDIQRYPFPKIMNNYFRVLSEDVD